MLPETQAQSLTTDISFSLVDVAYVHPSVDESEEPSTLQENPPADTFSYKVIKRGFDICVVLLISPFALVLCIAIALFVALDSPGSVLFSHRRIRHGGGSFGMWKFRTMYRNASEVLEKHFDRYPEDRKEWFLNHKLRNDPRVTPFGAFLRRTSLDELPQIWNVLVGDMTLVGPRPIVHEEVEKYGSDYAYYASVKPGVTGLWQTSGRSSLSYAERVALDRFYVENWNFWLELKILVRTIRSVASSDGAY